MFINFGLGIFIFFISFSFIPTKLIILLLFLLFKLQFISISLLNLLLQFLILTLQLLKLLLHLLKLLLSLHQLIILCSFAFNRIPYISFKFCKALSIQSINNIIWVHCISFNKFWYNTFNSFYISN